MTTDSPENAIADAKIWLRTAEAALAEVGKAARAEVIACAEAIHSIIRANDALIMSLLGLKATRHDDAPLLFKRLIREKKLEEKEARFALLLHRAVGKKSGADYGRAEISAADASYFVSEAKKFLEMAERHLPKNPRTSRPFR